MKPISGSFILNKKRYANFTWKPIYEPKHVSNRGTIVINRRMSQISSWDELNRLNSQQNRGEPCAPVSKLPANFHRPKSKYKKSIYNNAVPIYVSYETRCRFSTKTQHYNYICLHSKLKTKTLYNPMIL